MKEILAKLVRVDPDRSVHVAESDLRFPNGSIITPDGKTLVVAETKGNPVTAWTVSNSGKLSN